MKIHSEFTSLSARHAWLADVLNSEDVRDGGFARVVPFSGQSVIKATCCFATNLLFEELWEKVKRDENIPHHLPVVLRRFGAVVQDLERIKFTVWEIERFFEGRDRAGQTLARVGGRRLLAAYKPAYARQLARLTPDSLKELQEALSQDQAYFGSDSDWRASESIALSMVLRTEGTLRETFLFLREFVTKNKVCLDLLGTGNILVNMFGEPCLSDAVWDSIDEGSFNQPNESHDCLAVRVPVAVAGFKVQTQAKATLPLLPKDLQELIQACNALGLQPHTFKWASPELNAFLAQNTLAQSLWEFPQAALRLKTGKYTDLFCV